jgi:hypothetical protein
MVNLLVDSQGIYVEVEVGGCCACVQSHLLVVLALLAARWQLFHGTSTGQLMSNKQQQLM